MKILLTGYSGFLGKIISRVLSAHDIVRIGRDQKADITADISVLIPALPACDIVIHAAGKAHSVPKTLQEEQEFYTTNVQGTLNLLKAIEQAATLPAAFVFISSVAVYGKETGLLINEDSPLLAADAYGRTKVQAEEIVQYWCSRHQVRCVILRLPLIAGPNPPGNLRTMIIGIVGGYYFNIGGGIARKSMVLATDVAAIIPKSAEIGGIYNLTDGDHPSFSELSALIAKQLGKKRPGNISIGLAKALAKAGDILGLKAPINSDKLTKIISDLTFDDSKARRELNWNPTPVLEGFKIH